MYPFFWGNGQATSSRKDLSSSFPLTWYPIICIMSPDMDQLDPSSLLTYKGIR